MAELLMPGSDVAAMEVPHSFSEATASAERVQRVVVHPHPFYTYSQALTVPEGATVAEIVAAGGIPEAYHGFLRVWIGDIEVPRHLWHRVRPKAGKQVYVRATPQGGGGGDGKNVLASILMLVVTVAAAVFAPMIAGALGFAQGTVGFQIATSLIGAGISLVGALLVSSLIPPPPAGDAGLVGQRALLSGVRNQFQPYADIPRILGKRRVYPLQAARAYTEAQGKNRFLRVLLCVGWGPLKITDIKIGDTPITNFENVTYEVREGWNAAHANFGTLPVGKVADAPQTIFTKSVNEETFSILLDDAGAGVNSPGPWVSRTTDPDVAEISVDVTYPYGLTRFNDAGGTESVTLEVEVQYRQVGTISWTSVVWDGNDADDGTQTNGKIIGTDKSRTPTSRGGRFIVPAIGQYEVRMRRITARQAPESRFAQRIEWTAMRSIKRENPLNINGLALIALRMKATDQFNGFPDQINCIAESYLPSWNGTTWQWVESNRNPAWAYADLMRRRGTQRLIADSRIDVTAIRNWSIACAAIAPNASEPYWRFDGIFERGAIFTALKQVASHARASFCITDGKYSVVRDVAQTVPVQHITPRNSFGYQGQKAFVDLPHALKMQFINAALGYQEDEVIVYDDGFSEANASRFESIDLPGCTSPTQAWRDGRYYLAVGELRPESHTVSMDIEHLRCTLGDYVLLSHDVMSVGLSSGRIASRITAGANTTGFVLDEAVGMLPGISYVLRARRSDGSTALYSLQGVAVGTETTTVTLVTPVPTVTAAAAGDLFMFGQAALESAPMIVKKIEPGPEMTAKLTLVDAQPGVWTADTGAIPPFNTFITDQSPIAQQKPVPPSFTLTSDETVIERLADGTLQDRIGVTISAYRSTKVPVASLEVQFRESGAVDYQLASSATIATKQFFIAPVVQGRSYDVRVRAITEYGVASDWNTVLAHPVVGKTTPPSNVSGFTAQSRADGVNLTWNANPEVDVVGYEIRRGASWDTADIVSTLVTGTSFFASLSTTGSLNFLIRAVDAIGLKSPSAVSISSSVSAPGDVTFFEVYPQEDYIRATWTPVVGAGIEYEIRNGDNWTTARTVTRAAGNSVTVKWPIRASGSPIFLIRAISSAGILSNNATATSADQQPLANRNVIADVDFSDDGWAGTRINATPVGSGTGSTLLVDIAADGLTEQVADYYRTITLADTYYARNWIELLPILSGSTGITWQEATFTWEASGDATWLGSITDTAGTRLKAYIALQATGTTPPDLVEAFPLNGSTTGSAGTLATDAASIGYGSLHYGQGLNAKAGARARWLFSAPSIFTFLADFRYVVTAESNYTPFLLGIPADPSTGVTAGGGAISDFTLFRVFAEANSYTLRYVSAAGVFRLSATGQADMDLIAPMQPSDLLTFAVAQDATSRTLMAYNFRTGETYSVTAALAPLGAITEWRNFFTTATPETAPGSIGGVQVRNTAMALDSFSAYAGFHAPAGYAPFKELVPGDYLYQNAIVWLSLVNFDRTLNVQVAAAKLRVDVPDVVNRGTVSVGTSPTNVSFPATYKTLPTVQVTQTSGTLAVPQVTSITTTGFTVQLFNATSPATPVAGTISYTAAGY